MVLLALALPAIATWAFGRSYRASETDRVDTRLSAALRVAADSVAATDAAAVRSARSLAESSAVQGALMRHDRAALAQFASRHGAVSLSVRIAAEAPPAKAPGTIFRSVAVKGPTDAALGGVDAVEHLPLLLRNVSGRTGTTVRVSSAEGPVARPYYLDAGGRSYRAVHVVLGTGVGLVALVPRHEIDASVHRRELFTFGAASLTMIALALVILLFLPDARSAVLAGRRGQRSPLALFGDVVAAAHDPRALLPVILETTVSATGAAGGLGHGRIALDNARLHGVVRRQAVTDDLTDLSNRRRFMEALRQEVARSARLDTQLALVLFDLDHFKKINDKCGHQAGDDVLRSAADVIRTRVRGTDLAARIGGEEFAVILPGTDLAGAVSLAENLRRDISEGVAVPDPSLTLTASFGVAEHHPGEPAESLIGVADRALYRAKAEGRDRVNAADVGPTV